MVGLAQAAGVIGQPVLTAQADDSDRRPQGRARRKDARRRCSLSLVTDAIEHWHGLLRPDVELTPASPARFTDDLRARHLHFGDRIHCPFLRPFFLDEEQVALVTRVSRDHRADGRDAWRCGARPAAGPARRARAHRGRARAGGHRSWLQRGEHRLAPGFVHPARIAAVRRVQRRVAGRPWLHRDAGRRVRHAGAVTGDSASATRPRRPS